MNNLRRRVEKRPSIFDPVTGRGVIDGYEVVDLGLSNGLLFATCNVGAKRETEYGDYYMYGYSSQKYHDDDRNYMGTEDPLSPIWDTATVVMGEGWRMPTRTELQGLINNTNYEWVTNFNGSGIKGGKFTSKTNPNAYVFFPAAGHYYNGNNNNRGSNGHNWSSTPKDSYSAFSLGFGSGYKNASSSVRDQGFSVRGVHTAV